MTMPNKTVHALGQLDGQKATQLSTPVLLVGVLVAGTGIPFYLKEAGAPARITSKVPIQVKHFFAHIVADA